MTTRTSAEIEAGAKEYVWPSRLFSAEEQDTLWLRMSESDRRYYLETLGRAMSAADAAAPAVGVTVAWLDAQLERNVKQQSYYKRESMFYQRFSGYIDALQDVRALLTAQPEPVPAVAPGCVSVPLAALCGVLAWMECDTDAAGYSEIREAMIVLGTLAGEAITALPEPGTEGEQG